MKSKQSGLVLLTTLMLILISSLLVLSQMQLLLLDYKELNQFNEKRRSFRALETAAERLITEVALQAECILQEDSPNLAVNLLTKKRGCLLIHEQQAYYYLIEDLGVFPCLQVQREALTYSTHHLRISLRSMVKYPAILQIRVAKLAKFVQCTKQKPGQGRLGVLSWQVRSVGF